MILRIED